MRAGAGKDDMKTTRTVAIVGAGYAGVLAAGTTDAATIPLDHILHRDVNVIVGEVVRIMPHRNGLVIEASEGPVELPYDVLIYAVGSGAPPSIPGGTFSHSVGTHEGALAVRAAVLRLEPGNRIVVVGGGATGVEVASELAEENPEMDIRLLSAGQLLSSLPQPRTTQRIHPTRGQG